MLDKSRRGITAIVGPNGSGKSNIADAVRWVLGEQSMKTLRGKRGEDIIFSGSDKKGRLNMAEVSLYLNNEDKKVPIDYTQVTLTRRFFRDGSSEYLLNSAKVRLTDIQILLARASFGQKTYSVIGQGMVEGFLSTSLAERKEFFDEATGVKQYQIKRDESLNKLRSSYDNLSQAEMLLSEIEPRLRSLTRQVNRLQKREAIEGELKKLQLSYYAKIWHEINDQFTKINSQFLAQGKNKIEKEKKLSALNEELFLLQGQNGLGREFESLQNELNELQNKKESLTKELVLEQARSEIRLEAKGQFDLAWLKGKEGELEKKLAELSSEISEIEHLLKAGNENIVELEIRQAEINKKISNLNSDLIRPSHIFDDQELKKINQRFSDFLNRIKETENEANINNLKKLLKEVGADLKKFIELTENYQEKEKFKNLERELLSLSEEKEQFSFKLGENRLRVGTKGERLKLLVEQRDKTEEELKKIKQTLRQNGGGDRSKINSAQAEAKDQLAKINLEISQIKEKINNFSRQEESTRARLFELQKKLQQTQGETNQLNNQLNELKINSTRLETKLEDLEIEIRNDYGDLKDIKNQRLSETIDLGQAKEKIIALKKQIDLIGSIDPETEKEYLSTKERFDFLSTQAKDLNGAIGSLEKIIKELDLIIKDRFDQEFKVISKKFEEYFKILFNGGQSKIIKVMEEEEEEKEVEATTTEGESEQNQTAHKNKKGGAVDIKKIKFLQKHNATGLAGIEIQATPPGKKIKSVAMLSGGERALTAIALICAIINVNPSPFVVLDEVDAALDEANSERLAKILDDLSHKTQFIIITHNRATMRRANILYGVTMSDDGVSRLLSIKLEEKKELKK